MSHSVVCICSLDLMLLWLWPRLAATAPIQPLTSEPPYATGADLKSKQVKKYIHTYIHTYIMYAVSGLSGCPLNVKQKSRLFLPFCLLRATLAAYGGCQARGLNGSCSLHHSHSNAGCEPCLQPTPQLTAMSDP